MNSLIQTLRNWVKQPAEQYTYLQFPSPDAEVDPLLPYASYFRVTLAHLFLRDRQRWFTDLYPAAHTSIRIQHADYEPIELTHVTHVPGKSLASGIELNHTVTGLIPYNGGTLEIDCGLLAMHGKDHLDASIKMLGSFSDLVAAPVSQALTVAGKVATSVGDLFQGNSGTVKLNYGETFGEGNPPRPGHYATILATAEQLKGTPLSVENNRLMTAGKPLTGYDYLLFRLDAVKERGDWRMKEVQKNITAARKAYVRRKDDEGDEYRAAAIVAIYDSPDLSEVDRERVAGVVRDELDTFRQTGRGAVGDTTIEEPLETLLESAKSWAGAADEVARRYPLLRARLNAAQLPH